MSLKYAVLGFLCERSAHGYAIRRGLAERLGDLASTESNRIYGLLTTLEREGLVSAVDERVGRRRRRVYSIEPEGRVALLDFARRPLPALATRGDFAMRLLAVGADPDAAQEVLRTWRRHELRVQRLLGRAGAASAVTEVLRELASEGEE